MIKVGRIASTQNCVDRTEAAEAGDLEEVYYKFLSGHLEKVYYKFISGGQKKLRLGIWKRCITSLLVMERCS